MTPIRTYTVVLGTQSGMLRFMEKKDSGPYNSGILHDIFS